MEKLCQEILGHLNIYEKDYTQYTKCLYRKMETLISNRPEEKIRQIFLYFLIHQSGLFPNLISLEVEHRHLDIAIYQKIACEEFQPFQHPIAIIEVKRESENLLNHENQLLRYLNEQRSSIGILFNGNDLILLNKVSEKADFSRIHLRSLEEIPALLKESLTQFNSDFLEFDKARDGDVNSFIYLIRKYGKYTTHNFSFALKNSSHLIRGYCFSYDQDYIYYNLSNQPFPKKRLSFKYHAFDKLISIVY